MGSEGDEMYERDFEVQIPKSLDPHIASVSIRTGTNDPSEGFTISLSASFGRELIEIQSGKESLELEFSIRKAEVHLEGINCSLHLYTPSNQSEGWSLRETRRSASRREKGKHLALGASVSASERLSAAAELAGGFSGDRKATSERETSFERSGLPWRILSKDTVQIASLNGDGEYLSGRIVDEDVCTKVVPSDNRLPMAVVARLRVREPWVLATDFRPLTMGQKLQRSIAAIIQGGEGMERRRQMFEALLKHLVMAGLQSDDEKRDATIAADAIVFRPMSQKISGLVSAKRNRIHVPPHAIREFLTSHVGEESPILERYGVQIVGDFADASPVDVLGLVKSMVMDPSALSAITIYALSREDLKLPYWLANSIGVVLEISGDENSLEIQFKDVISKPKTTRDFVDWLESINIDLGGNLSFMALVSGRRAFALAKKMGFDKSYSTLQYKMKGLSVKYNRANAITLFDLAKSIGVSLDREQLVGKCFTID